MENLRLQVPEEHHRNRRRLFVAVALGGSLVVVIWAFQMKFTFDKFASSKQEVNVQTALETAETTLRPEAQEAKSQIQAFREALEQLISSKDVKQEVMTKVGESMNAELEARSQTPNPAAGTVAGEQTEVQPPVQP